MGRATANMSFLQSLSEIGYMLYPVALSSTCLLQLHWPAAEIVAMPNVPQEQEEVMLKDLSLESIDKWFTILLDITSIAPSVRQGLRCHNQALVTRHFLLSRPEVTRLEHTVNQYSPSLLRIWS